MERSADSVANDQTEIQLMKARLDGIDRSIKLDADHVSRSEKIILELASSIRWYIGSIGAALAIFLATASIFTGLNLSSQINAVNETKGQIERLIKQNNDDFVAYKLQVTQLIKDQFGPTAEPKIELKGLNGNELAGQELLINLVTRPPRPTNWDLEHPFDNYDQYIGKFYIVFKNPINVPTGTIIIKHYWSDERIGAELRPSSDEPNFKYELYAYLGDDTDNKGIASNVTYTYSIIIGVRGIFPERVPYKLRIYYGAGKFADATFYLKFIGPNAAPRGAKSDTRG